MVAFAGMLAEEGVEFNYQSDWSLLEAAAMYDTGTVSTNGKNFLRFPPISSKIEYLRNNLHGWVYDFDWQTETRDSSVGSSSAKSSVSGTTSTARSQTCSPGSKATSVPRSGLVTNSH